MNKIKSVYDFKALEFSGQEKMLKDYAGKVLLIVNTASQCYFTKQFNSLEMLYNKYKDRGFEILAFPSDNFGHQEPRTGRNLETFCRIEKGVTFPVFKRIHVRGEYQDPLFQYLSKKEQNGVINSTPRWNFHKYLVNKDGQVVDFYYSFTSPMSTKLQKDIEDLLNR